MNKLLSLFDNTSCFFHELTGLYCPGCGGTRAFIALMEGDLARSFFYHPIVLYGYLCLTAAVFILIRQITGKRRGNYHAGSSAKNHGHEETALKRLVIHALIGAAILLLLHYILRNLLTLFGLPAFP